jgi:hypothetical protein
MYDPERKKDVKKTQKKESLNDKAFKRLKNIKQTLFYKKEKNGS